MIWFQTQENMTIKRKWTEYMDMQQHPLSPKGIIDVYMSRISDQFIRHLTVQNTSTVLTVICLQTNYSCKLTFSDFKHLFWYKSPRDLTSHSTYVEIIWCEILFENCTILILCQTFISFWTTRWILSPLQSNWTIQEHVTASFSAFNSLYRSFGVIQRQNATTNMVYW